VNEQRGRKPCNGRLGRGLNVDRRPRTPQCNAAHYSACLVWPQPSDQAADTIVSPFFKRSETASVAMVALTR
jgi:hypothetical protein